MARLGFFPTSYAATGNLSYHGHGRLGVRVLLQVIQGSAKLIQPGEVFGLGGPFVSFKDIGTGFFTFEVGGYVRNINDRGGVASELRYALLAALAAANIELPSSTQQLQLMGELARTAALPPAVPPAG